MRRAALARTAARFFCPACAGEVSEFAAGPGERPHARCPRCQALERHRFLCYLIDRLSPFVVTCQAVLDVAPHNQVRGLLWQRLGNRYVGLDLELERRVDVLGDVTRLPFRDEIFDLVVCYHVFEHVPDDKAAMRELRRVTAAGGMALVQVPIREGTITDEDPSATREERVRRFGQDDHVRWYGDDFEERLRAAGWDVSRITPGTVLAEAALTRMAIRDDEPVWICRAATAGQVPGGPSAEQLRTLRSAVESSGAGCDQGPIEPWATRVGRRLPSRARRRLRPLVRFVRRQYARLRPRTGR